jgi:hypothetical protein
MQTMELVGGSDMPRIMSLNLVGGETAHYQQQPQQLKSHHDEHAEEEEEKWTGFTSEQQSLIVKFVQSTKSRSPWSDLAKLMKMR